MTKNLLQIVLGSFLGLSLLTPVAIAQRAMGSAQKADTPLLHLADEEELLLTCALVMEVGPGEPSSLSTGQPVKTLFDRFNEVTEAEWENEREGGPAEHSNIYDEALRREWIREILDPDGATSYDYATSAPELVPVLNDEGMVAVGTTLYQYTPSFTKECTYLGQVSVDTLRRASESGGGVRVTPSQAYTTCGSYNWGKPGSWAYWDNSRKRVRLSVTGNSSCIGTSVQKVTYSVNVKVEKKNFFGNWVAGDFTCCYLYTSWKFRFGLAKNSVPFLCPLFYSQNLSPFPVAYTYPTTYWPSINNLTVALHPNGYWSTNGSGYDYFCDAFNVYQYSFSGSVCGGASGVNLNGLVRP